MWYLIAAIVFLFIVLVYMPYRKEKKFEEILDKVKPKLEEAIRETELCNSNKIPTNEDIDLYYKMYLKKWYLDHEDKWETEIVKPIEWDEWKKRATTSLDTVGGYRFIISRTMDMFIGFPPNVNMMRYRDYKQMVLNEEKEIDNEKNA